MNLSLRNNQNYLPAAAREVVRRRSLVLGRGSLVARRAPVGKILPVPKMNREKPQLTKQARRQTIGTKLFPVVYDLSDTVKISHIERKKIRT